MISAPFSLEVADALMQPNVNVAMAAEFFFDSGTSRVHTGVGEILLNGEVFFGLGTLGSVGAIEESNSTSASKLAVTLSGVETQMLGIVMNEECVGREVVAYIVVFDDQFKTLASNKLFRGKISESHLEAGSTSEVNYTISNIFEEWSRGQPWRFTDESMKKLHSGDRIMRYVAQMAERSIFWGNKKDAPAFRYD